MSLTPQTLLKTLVRGFLFLIPIVLTLLLIREAIRFIAGAVGPISKLVATETPQGPVVTDAIAVFALAALCFVAGLFASTAIGAAIGQKLEDLVLRRLPGFTLMKSALHGAVDEREDSDVTAALAWIEESWVLGFIMERHSNGLCTVFVPSAPTPAADSVYYLPPNRLKPLDVPVRTAVACIMRLGVGSRELLADALPKADAPKDAAAGAGVLTRSDRDV